MVSHASRTDWHAGQTSPNNHTLAPELPRAPAGRSFSGQFLLLTRSDCFPLRVKSKFNALGDSANRRLRVVGTGQQGPREGRAAACGWGVPQPRGERSYRQGRVRTGGRLPNADTNPPCETLPRV